MHQHEKRTCKACGVIVFAHLTDCFVAFTLPLPSSLLIKLLNEDANMFDSADYAKFEGRTLGPVSTVRFIESHRGPVEKYARVQLD